MRLSGSKKEYEAALLNANFGGATRRDEENMQGLVNTWWDHLVERGF